MVFFEHNEATAEFVDLMIDHVDRLGNGALTFIKENLWRGLVDNSLSHEKLQSSVVIATEGLNVLKYALVTVCGIIKVRVPLRRAFKWIDENINSHDECIVYMIVGIDNYVDKSRCHHAYYRDCPHSPELDFLISFGDKPISPKNPKLECFNHFPQSDYTVQLITSKEHQKSLLCDTFDFGNIDSRIQVSVGEEEEESSAYNILNVLSHPPIYWKEGL